MTSDRWKRVEEIYHAALALGPAERSSYVRDASGGDGALATEVESLLANDADAASFLEVPAAVAAAAVDIVGRQIGSYQITGRLGAGGMGEVYLARHPRFPRFEALKVLHADLSADPDFQPRFNREAELAAGLNLPFAPISQATADRLAAVLEPGLAPANPLDAWGTGWDAEALFAECLSAMAADPAVAAVALTLSWRRMTSAPAAP